MRNVHSTCASSYQAIDLLPLLRRPSQHVLVEAHRAELFEAQREEDVVPYRRGRPLPIGQADHADQQRQDHPTCHAELPLTAQYALEQTTALHEPRQRVPVARQQQPRVGLRNLQLTLQVLVIVLYERADGLLPLVPVYETGRLQCLE